MIGLIAGITFLTPAGAALAAATVLPLVALVLAAARVRRVLSVLRLPPPRAGVDLTTLAALAVVVALLGIAAAQPAIARDVRRPERTDVQALFVVDVSKSMAASASPDAPTRIDGAIAAAERLRSSIPDVESGVATLTDRVLPDLLPVADGAAFDATLERAVGIEEPPPETTAVVATSYAALSQLASGNDFSTRKRIVVLLTDGESATFDAGDVARALARPPAIALLSLRVGSARDAIYLPGGKVDPGYRPDPDAAVTLHELAAATGGSTFDASQVGAASSALRRLVGNGPVRATAVVDRSATPIGPYVAVAALLALAVVAGRRAYRLV